MGLIEKGTLATPVYFGMVQPHAILNENIPNDYAFAQLSVKEKIRPLIGVDYKHWEHIYRPWFNPHYSDTILSHPILRPRRKEKNFRCETKRGLAETRHCNSPTLVSIVHFRAATFAASDARVHVANII
ncbi:hypothetical protein PCH_Pc22g20990 [Penicillium rubens Wisconsin 54-1255]|uniref:Uncharacterized protein n=1 Tax=Penicillium rubens (strain ATCC 28089 / DSM 1075 / NRRL 1951 / Wisconsin 54-1255) TaxID=500485 RepID=B6HS15_PENRW|nr:hypothetical protein PCH_Pc22g20990 [Penicillium rubens Wisconsin 54-1255]